MAEESLWGFRIGDIITSDNPQDSLWYQTRLIVKCFTAEGHLYVQPESGYNVGSGIADSPEHLILLERPGWKFKVGDEVEVIDDSPSKGKRGKVIVLDPGIKDVTGYITSINYLTKLGNYNGDDESDNDEPWYPEKYKNITSRFWRREEDLKLLKPAKEVKKTKPKQTLTPLEQKILEAVDEMLKLISKTKDMQKLGKTFYHAVDEGLRHSDISYLIDGYPRLKDDDTWRIVVKLFRGEYENAGELKRDLNDLKKNIKQKIKD